MKLAITTIGTAMALAFGTPAIAQQQPSQGEQAQSKQSQSSQDEMKGIVTATGKVMGNAQIKTTAGDMHDLVKLQRTSGGTVIVDLGVSAPQVQQGDQLFVHGYSARISGKPVIFARYIAELQEVGMTDEPSATAGGSSAAADDDLWDEDWKQDDFGYFDEDFEWTSDNSGFTSFYGDGDEAWGAIYDDVGDEGLFDV